MAVTGDWNIIIDGFTLPGDHNLIFGNQDVQHFPSNISFADIMVHFGIFPSKGQARKNGWDKDIPWGFSEWTVGKLKHRLTIWKPSQEWIER
jgi:hypothetical protein